MMIWEQHALLQKTVPKSHLLASLLISPANLIFLRYALFGVIFYDQLTFL